MSRLACQVCCELHKACRVHICFAGFSMAMHCRPLHRAAYTLVQVLPPCSSLLSRAPSSLPVPCLLTTPVASLQGELISYNDYQKNFKVMYDDGEDEWTSLHKEVFRLAPFHLPRPGVSAQSKATASVISTAWVQQRHCRVEV